MTALTVPPAYSDERWVERLGTFDQLAVALVVDHVDTPGGTVSAVIEHSSDGRTWDEKTSTPCVTGTTVSGQTQLSGRDNSGMPSLAYVRFRFWFEDPSKAGRVRLQVSARDAGP